MAFLKAPTSCLPAVSAVCAGMLLLAGDPAASRAPTPGRDRLVAYEPINDVCLMPAAVQRETMRTAYALAAQDAGGRSGPGAPVRTVRDPYPSFASVALDLARNEVVFTDESLFQVLVYDRLENTPEGAAASKPKRSIAGEKTHIEFQSGVYVDEATGEIYAVNNDTRDRTVIFDAKANGDVAPVRDFKTPHGTYGIAAAVSHNEVLMTVQHDAGVVTYRKTAADEEAPIRLIQGDKTRLADPHGIAYDPKEDVIFVANFGSWSRRGAGTGSPSGRPGEDKPNWPLSRGRAIPGSGIIGPASITVYARTASGNVAPLRVIEGPRAQLDWPTGVAVDPEQRELYVTNDMGASVLVFDAGANGNQAPKRILKGPKTGLQNPTGVALDLKNRELWVANFGGHSATVYALDAANDTAPRRTIRNAPPGSPSLMIGNPGAVTFDTKREEILVPN